MKFNKERFEVLIGKCSKWSKDRNIIKGSTASAQSIMLATELGELAEGIRKDNKELIIDAIGDMLVVLNGMCLQILNVDLKKFSQYVYGSSETEFTLNEDFAQLGKSTFNLIAGVAGRKEMIKHRIQNVISDLNYICIRLDLSLSECLEHSYNEIKDRKGIMFNGSFIKSSDKDYTQIARIVAGSIAPNGNIIQ
mgnify:CR=1 FL=1